MPNTSLACINCRVIHRRCITHSEGICTNCRHYGLPCVYVQGKKRGPKSNSQSPSNINPCGTATEVLLSSLNDSSSFETPHAYNTNHLNDSSSVEIPLNVHQTSSDTYTYETNDTFIDQSFLLPSSSSIYEGSMQNNNPSINLFQNITSSFTNYSNDSSSFNTTYLNIHPYGTTDVHIIPVQNNDSLTISPSQNATTSSISYSNDSSSLEIPYPYNSNIINSPNTYTYESNDTFIDQSFLLPSSSSVHEGSMQNNNPSINLSQNITSSFTDYSNDSSSFNTTYLNIHPYGTTDVHEIPTQNNDSLTISPSQNVTTSSISYSNDSSSLEIPYPYNSNIINSPNIYTYETNDTFIDQSFLLPSSSSVYEGSMQNNNPSINLSQNITSSFTNHSNDSSSSNTTHLNVHPYGTTEVFQNTFVD
ncbi:11039_t:CDS:1 [Dentiscutata heterogama]|uniref:11039_t:CDS:1 n=1 Tax=Dentiscutata heterogama TaxID=1316150 RepID=A0ACA9L5I4_9GLOM|nr:11039_t:CDS:1 [Dentiscutata heterogama]